MFSGFFYPRNKIEKTIKIKSGVNLKFLLNLDQSEIWLAFLRGSVHWLIERIPSGTHYSLGLTN